MVDVYFLVSSCSGAKRCKAIVVKSLLERAIHASIIKGISGSNLFVDSKKGGSPIKNNVPYLSKDAIVPGVQGGYVWGKK